MWNIILFQKDVKVCFVSVPVLVFGVLKEPSGIPNSQQNLYFQIIPLFYKIPMTRVKGEDVSALEEELKEKFSKLNKV